MAPTWAAPHQSPEKIATGTPGTLEGQRLKDSGGQASLKNVRVNPRLPLVPLGYLLISNVLHTFSYTSDKTCIFLANSSPS